MRDGDLGRFLRNRRESVTPTDVGLPAGPRRRTPGLRRAELATLAGISVDYLVRLEQGRDTHPSAQVLAAIVDALRLDEEDRAHVRKLSWILNGPELCPSARPIARSVRPATTALLESLDPTPAFVLNRLSDVLAWNAAFDRIAGPLGILGGDVPNLVRYTFADERARATFPDWNAVADEQVTDLRAGEACGDPPLDALVAELTAAAGAAFSERWAAHPLAPKRTGIRRLVHPDVGDLRLSFNTLSLSDLDEQRLVVYLAADDATEVALDHLSGRYPGGLRAIARPR